MQAEGITEHPADCERRIVDFFQRTLIGDEPPGK